jgi:hypothetical protein
MGLHWRRRRSCERSARSISLRLDGQLSQLEQAALDRHLTGCESCRALDAELSGFTRLLRGAPLVELGRPVRVDPPGGGRRRVLRHATAAAAVLGMLAAAGAGSIVVSKQNEQGADASSALAFASAKEQLSYALMQQVRLEPGSAPAAETPASVMHRVLL